MIPMSIKGQLGLYYTLGQAEVYMDSGDPLNWDCDYSKKFTIIQFSRCDNGPTFQTELVFSTTRDDD